MIIVGRVKHCYTCQGQGTRGSAHNLGCVEAQASVKAAALQGTTCVFACSKVEMGFWLGGFREQICYKI